MRNRTLKNARVTIPVINTRPPSPNPDEPENVLQDEQEDIEEEVETIAQQLGLTDDDLGPEEDLLIFV